MHIYGLQENGTDEPICRTVIERLAQIVKNLPTTWETWVRSLGWEDLLEKGMAITLVFLPGKSHGQRSLVGYTVDRVAKSPTLLKN